MPIGEALSAAAGAIVGGAKADKGYVTVALIVDLRQPLLRPAIEAT